MWERRRSSSKQAPMRSSVAAGTTKDRRARAIIFAGRVDGLRVREAAEIFRVSLRRYHLRDQIGKAAT